MEREVSTETIDLPSVTAWLVKYLVFGVVLLIVINGFLGLLQLLFNVEDTGFLFVLFDFNAEANLPTWYTTVLLFSCSLLFGFIGWLQRGDKDSRYWRGLVFIFLYLSADEAAGLHEGLVVLGKRMLNVSEGLSENFYFAWTLPIGVALVVVLLVYLRFLMRLPRKTRFGILIAAALYVGGEILGALLVLQYGSGILTGLAVILEESLEVFGVLFFLYVLMQYIRSRTHTSTFALRG